GRRAPRRRRPRQHRTPLHVGRLLPVPGLPDRHRADGARRLPLDEPAKGLRRRDQRIPRRRSGRPRRALRSPMTTRSPKPAGSTRSWPVPAALIALVAVAVIAGVLRLVQLSGGAAKIPPNPRF